jgi:hypothetical protein
MHVSLDLMELNLAFAANADAIVACTRPHFLGVNRFDCSETSTREQPVKAGDIMSIIRLRLPDSLHKMIKEVAARDKISINLMITIALAEKLSALETEDYLVKRAQMGSRTMLMRTLAKVPDKAPDKKDTLSS